MHGRRWPAQWEMVREQTCRAVVALSTCGSRSMRAREAVSVRGGCAADLRGSAPHCDCSHFFEVVGAYKSFSFVSPDRT